VPSTWPMIILKKEWLSPSFAPSENRLTPRKHQEGMELHIGEMVIIMMDYTDAKDWYVAEVAQVLGDRFTVNGFTTTGAPLVGYKTASRKDRVRALHGINLHRTWCKDKGKGEGTIIPPAYLKGREKYLWNWRIPIGEVNQLLLIRNVILEKDGCLCKITKELAAALKHPHHVGAGGAETES
jgi:hypothetical protein